MTALRNSQILGFKPSCIAAGSLLIAIKLKRPESTISSENWSPLRMWDKNVERLTGLICDVDVEPVYNHLLCRIKVKT